VTRSTWPAPHAGGPVRGTVRVPGSKSMTNRALVLAALATTPSRLLDPLVSRDTTLMADGLRALGVTVSNPGPAAQVAPTGPRAPMLRTGGRAPSSPAGRPDPVALVVEPADLAGPAEIDCGLAGTVMRFLPPVAALATGRVGFDGDPAARLRPMSAVLDALRVLGVGLDGGADGHLPFTVDGEGRVRGGEVTLDASASSQFVSGLLLAGFRFDDGVTVRHRGGVLPSVPYVDMSVAMLRDAGVSVRTESPDLWVVEPGSVPGRTVPIEPDLSGAAPFLAAAVVTGGRVTIGGWPRHTHQPGDQLRELFVEMGAVSSLTPDGLVVAGSGSVHGLDRELRDVGELVPVLAAVAAVADGPSHFRGIGHLRGHETDRIAALTTELGSLGARVEAGSDELRIHPAPMHGGVFRTYADHRMAHAAAVLGLVVPGIELDDVTTTEKTMPGFADMWAALVDDSERMTTGSSHGSG
jgi:3-phosphoshikimate 1-carboxyvinyltransferase